MDKNEKSSEGFKNKVFAVLQKVNNLAVGEFAVSAVLTEAPPVVISLKNNSNSRRLHFPIYEDEADGIIQSFEQSPYGKGSQTIVDTSERNSWELEPQQFEILNPKWDLYIKEVLLPLIGKEMKIDTTFTSSLYKLLLYKTGSFSKPLRDSEEKEDGMFAKLVIQLPSKYKGGQLRVSHDGKMKTFDLSADEFSTYCTAFYCDCEHEVLPVSEGFRICLIYNLISQGTPEDSLPVAPERSPIEKELKAVLKNWDSPGKIIYALKHKYTHESLSFANLLTTDRAIAAILKHLSKKYALNVYLAIFEKRSQGEGEGYSNPNYGFSNPDDIDFDSDDGMHSKAYRLNTFIPISGHEMLSNTNLIVNFENEVIPETCFSNIEPCLKTQEPSGNGSVPCKKYYRSAAIVFWKRKYIFDVLKSSKASNAELINSFIKEVEFHKGKETGEDTNKSLIEFARTVVNLKSEKKYKHYNSEEEGDEDNNCNQFPFASLLAALGHLKDVPSIQTFFENSLILNREVLPLVVEQCQHFGLETFSEQVVPMILRASSRRDATEFLELVSEDDKTCAMNEEKRNVLFNVMNAILDNYKSIGISSCSWPYFSEIEKSVEAKRKILNSQEEDVQSIVRVGEKINFNMVELLKKLFKDFVIMSEKILPWVETECNKHRWKFFGVHVELMFERVEYVVDAVELLDSFIGIDALSRKGKGNDKRLICCKVLSAICKRITKEKLFSASSKLEIQEADQDRLVSLCFSAHKINFNIVEFLKILPLNVVVPVLITLAYKENVFQGQWLHIANYFVSVMDKLSAKKDFTWALTDVVNPCSCKDCGDLDVFLKSDCRSQRLGMEKTRCQHLQSQINVINENMASAVIQNTKADIVCGSMVFVITKTVKNGMEELILRDTAAELLTKLVPVMLRVRSWKQMKSALEMKSKNAKKNILYNY